MLVVRPVDLNSKKDINKFVDFQFDMYKECNAFTPPIKADIRLMLNKAKHPYYDHSFADFFIAERDGEMVGKIAALENIPFNTYHQSKDAEFYLFDCIDDQDVANALFDTVKDWAKKRGLTKLIGPKGFGPLDGYGIQIEGFEEHQMMNMMNYNYPYYQKLVETYGFSKIVDFASSYIDPQKFTLPEKIHKAAEIAKKRGTFEVVGFKNKRELKAWAKKIGVAYNSAFVKNWEYFPLSDKEISNAVDSAIMIVDPKIFKIIVRQGEVVGFVFPFPDITRAFKKNKGKLGPIEILRLLTEINRTDWIDFNGIGILPEYQGLGGNAIIYSELEKSMKTNPRFKHAELTQVAETASQMRKDLLNLGVIFYKNHRVYGKDI